MTDERRSCSECEHAEFYYAPKGATTRLVCKRAGKMSVEFARAPKAWPFRSEAHCGPLAIFWKKKEWV